MFNLEGLLPQAIETIEDQVKRAYQQYCGFQTDLDKHVYLRSVQDTNETLFYKLIIEHLQEMMPVIYTPTVGQACQLFSRIYRRKRGLFISYQSRHRMDEILNNATKQKTKIIVVTDSERILGLGDQGVGGMGIPIGKLSLYSACGGISPAYTLPVILDAGTNNQQLLDDPLYMGWRHERIRGEDYFEFVDQFITAVKQRWPHALIQFEDFAQANATPLLKKYQHQVCCFNDDIQGTAAVTVGTLLAATQAQNTPLREHRVVFVGAGSAGCGIAQQIVTQMCEEGLSEAEALERIYLCSVDGLLTDASTTLLPFQEKFAQDSAKIKRWEIGDFEQLSLLDVVRGAQPSILIGVSGVRGLITREIIAAMLENCPNPIILPLSNPTSQVEAQPEDLIRWTDGRAIVATGSPFAPVEYNGRHYPIAQCNNSYIFPGIGLGVIACEADRITDKMFMVASEVLAECSPLVRGESVDLLPPLDAIPRLSRKIAFAVGMQAMQEGVAQSISREQLKQAIDHNFWTPEYRQYKRTSL